MNRSTRRAVSAAVIGLALGLVTGLPPWPERTVTDTISLLLLAAAAVAAMWALFTIDEGLVPEPAPDAEVPDGEPWPDAPATARIHHLDLHELAQLAGCHTLVYRAVADVPTAFYMTAAQLDNGVIVGQLPAAGGAQEQFGLVLAKGSGLTACVSKAVDALRADGTLAKLATQWLTNAGAPALK